MVPAIELNLSGQHRLCWLDSHTGEALASLEVWWSTGAAAPGGVPQLGWSGPPTRPVGDAEFRAGLSLAERVLPLLADYPEAITMDPEAAGLALRLLLGEGEEESLKARLAGLGYRVAGGVAGGVYESETGSLLLPLARGSRELLAALSGDWRRKRMQQVDDLLGQVDMQAAPEPLMKAVYELARTTEEPAAVQDYFQRLVMTLQQSGQESLAAVLESLAHGR